jgi:putative IMPACT (imprinted ancient) family translation regulator
MQVQLAVVTPFDCLGTVYNMLAKHGAAAGEEEYQSNGKVKLLLTADADQAEALQQAIADATSGRVQPKLVAPDDDS